MSTLHAGYIRLSDKKYPCTIADIGADHPEKYIPEGMSDVEYRALGYAIVAVTEQPTFNTDCEQVTQGDPVELFGQYKQTWVFTPLPEGEVMANIAAKRKQQTIIMAQHVETTLHTLARSKDYRDYDRAASYAKSKHAVRAAEAQRLIDYADEAWDYYYFAAGKDILPALDVFIAGMPIFSW